MIDWPSVLASIPWLLGMALLLAVSSQVSYLAARDRARDPQERRALRKRLAQSSVRRLFYVALGLIFLSLSLLAHSWGERLITIAGLGVSLYSSWTSRGS